MIEISDKSSRIDGLLECAALTDRGKVRRKNEDSVLVSARDGLLIVSDGMGGRNAGATASRLVVECLPPILEKALASISLNDPEVQIERINDALVRLSRQVLDVSKGRPGLAGMGATVVMAVFRGKRVFIGHMGDSRAYLYRDHQLRLLTDDDSVVGILLRQGEISLDQVADHPARGLLSRFVGMEGETRATTRALDLVSGDLLLLCSDGLTCELPDRSIVTILDRCRDIDEACSELIKAANDVSAQDNITVVVARWSEIDGGDSGNDESIT
jgi:protein phosphatase